MLSKMSVSEVIILLEKELQEKYDKEIFLLYDDKKPDIILNFNDEAIDTEDFAKIKEWGNTYITIETIEDKQTITVEKKNMVRNKLVELFEDVKIKEELYNAIYEGKRVRWTRNRRGIPTKSFVYETSKRYIEVVIDPKKEIYCYTDYDMTTIEGLVKLNGLNERDIMEYKRYLKKYGNEKFAEMFDEEVENITYGQYSSEDFTKYIGNYEVCYAFIDTLKGWAEVSDKKPLIKMIANKLITNGTDIGAIATVEEINKRVSENGILVVEQYFPFLDAKQTFINYYDDIMEVLSNKEKYKLDNIWGDKGIKDFAIYSINLAIYCIMNEIYDFYIKRVA